MTVVAILWVVDTRAGKPLRRTFSPTNSYHSVVLFGGMSYVVVTTAFTVFGGIAWSQYGLAIALNLLFLGIWLALGVLDARQPAEVTKYKDTQTHIADWVPIWSKK